MKTRNLCVAVAAAVCMAVAPSRAANLTHRWSFNGTTEAECLADSIGTSTASVTGSHVTFKDGMAHLTGWDKNTGNVNLGTGILGTGSATIEIWAKKTGIKQWSRVFEYGPNSSYFLMLTWTRDNDPNNTSLALYSSGKKIDNSYSGTPYYSETMYHISMTLTVSGSDTIVRWMRRNVRTGAIECEGTDTASGWTLASFSNPSFRLGFSNSNDKDANASYDEVRIYSGVVGDAQLSANAVAGPDALLATSVTDSASGFTVDADATFTVSSPGTASVSGAATFGSGAKILFDTSSFHESSATFSASSFSIADGNSLADIVEVTNPDWYEATVSGNAVTVAPKSGFAASAPVTATWNGGTAAPDADAITNSANWTCRNIDGTVISDAVPSSVTTVVIPAGSTAFTIPDGYTPPWAGIRFGDVSTTRYGKIQYTGERYNGNSRNYGSGIAMEDASAWIEVTPFSYTSTYAQQISSLTSALSGNVMNNAQMRFDGWINVTASQAGLWTFKQTFDDYIAIAIDGKLVFHLNAYSYTEYGSCYVTRGWHRFTIVCGDTWGGQSTSFGTTVSINGGSYVNFDSSFTLGTGGTSTITLADDCDWSALGALTLDADAVIDLAGHDLKVADIDVDFIGAMVTNTSSTVSTVYFTSDPYQTKAYSRHVLQGLGANIRILQFGARVARWTGAAGDGDISNAANWSLTFDGKPTSDTLPTTDYTVLIEGDDVNMQVPSGTTLACAAFTIGECSFAADCDWRGLSVTPNISTVADLKGHNLYLNSLSASGNASFTNTVDGTISDVRFTPTSSKTSETDFISGIANLTTYSNARIALVDADSYFSASSISIGNASGNHPVFVQSNGTVSVSGKIDLGISAYGAYEQHGGDVSVNTLAVGATSGGTGEYTITNGTLTATSTTTQIGSNDGTGIFNISGDATVTLKDTEVTKANGNATVNVGGNASVKVNGWLMLGRGNGPSRSKAVVNQTGGTVETTGEVQFGYTGSGTYNISGGSLVAGDNLQVGRGYSSTSWGNRGEGYLNQSGGSVVCNKYLSIGRYWNGEAYGYYTMTGGTYCSPNQHGIVGEDGVGTLDVSGTGVMFFPKGLVVGLNNKESSKGTVRVHDGGRIVTSSLYHDAENAAAATATAEFAGGTVVLTNAESGVTLLSGFNSLTLGDGGITVDTAGHNATLNIPDTFSRTDYGSALVKDGEGALTIAALPDVSEVRVNAGSLIVQSGGDNTASSTTNTLAHRWSFNGDFTDSVGGAAATLMRGSVSFTSNNTEAVMSGGANAGSLNLGTGVLGSGNATIEIWATHVTPQIWPYLVAYGSDSGNVLDWAWRNGNNGYDNAHMSYNGESKFWTNYITEYPEVGIEYHFALTFTDNGDGSTALRFTRRRLADGEIVETKTRDITVSDWTLADVVSSWVLSVGYSPFTEVDAGARYNEVRVWHSALSDTVLAVSALYGPDATAAQIASLSNAASARTLNVASGARVSLQSGALTQPVVAGSGTISGGRVNVTTAISPGGDGTVGTLTLPGGTVTGEIRLDVGDKIVVNGGTLDISGATVTLLDPSNIGEFVFIECVNGGSVTGMPTVDTATIQSPWKVQVSGSRAKIGKSGIAIFLR